MWQQPDGVADELEDDDLTDSVPKVRPAYADATYEELGEQLARLYLLRDHDPNTDRSDEIAVVAAKMRRGPRLHPGEFLCDGRFRLLRSVSNRAVDGHWEAFDKQAGQRVFLTVFHGRWVDDEDSLSRFRKRGRKLEKLSHPRIGRVHEATKTPEGWVVLAQDFFASGSLRQLVATDGFDATAAVQVIIEAASGLRHAHDQGVVHGAVQPSNVMIADDGAAHLVDFSVSPDGSTEWGSLFAAPETSERDYTLGPAADVYGLGMTALFALNAGDLPVWVLRDPGRLIEAVDAPEHVKRVISKATEWDLDRRYPDVRTLLRELMSDPELVRTLADRALEIGRLDVSATHFEKLLKTQPHRGVPYRTVLGDIYTRMKAYDRAHEHLVAALERTTDVVSLFEPLRAVAAATDKWSRLAEVLWTQARHRDAGRRVVLRMELARINQHELGDAGAAAETWGQVLAEHRTPEQADAALDQLMQLARDRSDWEAFVGFAKERLLYVDDTLERAPIEYAIGRTLIEYLDATDEGLRWIDRAEEKGHTELDLAPTLQQIRAERGQWRRVIQLMVAQARHQDISEASPTLLRAGIIAGAVHFEEEAFRVYHTLLERAPRHVVALRHLARMHHRAREHDRALPFYERLWETYRGRDTEEPEASERAADCTAYASILLRSGRPDEAMARLEEALRLTPHHVPALQLAGPLWLAMGKVHEASQVFERMLRLFKSVEHSPQKVEACLGMGELAWVSGRLTAAMGWYNRAIELEPFSSRAWWGLAKVALAARSGHEGADRAPWVKAVPKRFTTMEALARLLVGVIDASTMTRWLEQSALGRAMVEGGGSPLRLAACMVDRMVGNELVSPDLFQRLEDACPDWAGPVEEVKRLWFDASAAASFPVPNAYGWSKRTVANDFDPSAERSVLPPDPMPHAAPVEDLSSATSWKVLFSGDMPAPPEPLTVIEEAEEAPEELLAGPVGALVRDDTVWLQLDRTAEEAVIGRSFGSALRIIHDESVRPVHGRLFRRAGRIYLASEGGRIRVDGEDRELWRLVGGERVTVGETRLHYVSVEDVAELPERRREPPQVPDEELRRAKEPEPEPEVPEAEAADAEEPALRATETGVAESTEEVEMASQPLVADDDDDEEDDEPTRLIDESPAEVVAAAEAAAAAEASAEALPDVAAADDESSIVEQPALDEPDALDDEPEFTDDVERAPPWDDSAEQAYDEADAPEEAAEGGGVDDAADAPAASDAVESASEPAAAAEPAAVTEPEPEPEPDPEPEPEPAEAAAESVEATPEAAEAPPAPTPDPRPGPRGSRRRARPRRSRPARAPDRARARRGGHSGPRGPRSRR